MHKRTATASLVTLLGLALVPGTPGCGGGSPTSPVGGEPCGGFGDWQASEYVLPYPVGTSYPVLQGSCTNESHKGFWRYGYDITMEIGTLVTAARDGVVVFKEERAQDGNRELTNLVTVEHADGTVALYSHLTRGGALVEIGQSVRAGDPVGLSGNTGNTSRFLHLHFSLHPCAGLPGLPDETHCPSIPANFSNTDPNPQGLQAGREYLALPFR